MPTVTICEKIWPCVSEKEFWNFPQFLSVILHRLNVRLGTGFPAIFRSGYIQFFQVLWQQSLTSNLKNTPVQFLMVIRLELGPQTESRGPKNRKPGETGYPAVGCRSWKIYLSDIRNVKFILSDLKCEFGGLNGEGLLVCSRCPIPPACT